jgi:hypothetical protein
VAVDTVAAEAVGTAVVLYAEEAVGCTGDMVPVAFPNHQLLSLAQGQITVPGHNYSVRFAEDISKRRRTQVGSPQYFQPEEEQESWAIGQEAQ